ncbi:MAG: NAD(P)/FAD-dependent oxidoreductase, partial [Candidatus Hydrothermarchaeaceae archaeon]
MAYDAIVVGAGISGLLSALALSKNGKKVLIIEKSKCVGGLARSYDVDGYKVDIGPHAITALKDGPLVTLMDKYFDIVPQFIPHENYYVRTHARFSDFPWTLKEWMLFDILPRKDRLFLVQAITRGAALTLTDDKALNISVHDFIGDLTLSDRTIKFIDALCYLLTGRNAKETPTWRMLRGSGYIEETKRGPREHFSRFIKLARHNASHNQCYPRGGVEAIVKSAEYSLPKNMVDIRLNESVTSIHVEDGHVKGVGTSEDSYDANTVVYSGYAKYLPKLVNSDLPPSYVENLKRIKQTTALAIWLGLSSRAQEFNYKGSEIWFEEGKPYWAMPTSNFDPHLAPMGKQLIGFAFVVEDDLKKERKRALDTIYTALPDIERRVEMEHVQVAVPEKAAATVDCYFPSPKSPINGLYLVGTDTNSNSMGITRASYSVLDCLRLMK